MKKQNKRTQNFYINYTLFYPGRKGESMCATIKAYDAYKAILKLKTQKGWYQGDKHPKARIKIESVYPTDDKTDEEIEKTKKEIINIKYCDNDPIMPDGIYR